MKKVLLAVFGGIVSLFVLLFTVYFFNLDMKFMAYVVDPVLQFVYDHRKPNYYV